MVFDDVTLRQVLRNATVVAEFPFMRHAAESVQPKTKRGCGSCGAKNRTNAGDLNGIRSAIATMPNDKKARLKQILEADEIRLYYTNVKRQKVKVTF
jgi:hypothetical protein